MSSLPWSLSASASFKRLLPTLPPVFLYTEGLEGQEMQTNASFPVSWNTGPLQTATSTVSTTSVVFCVSAVQKYLLAQVTAAHTAALCWLPLYWSATKESTAEIWTYSARLLSSSEYFSLPMYVPCRGSIKVGCRLNTAAPWASKTAVRHYY